ncbi:hypothetical protein HY844_00155 [Candidatus Berkelbacteria bacterium]|nr:hypothetical protein [Candidatus Berkelbacteria bacterium]
MWFSKKNEDKSFVAVALVFILLGAAIFAFGAVSWMINTMQQQTIVAIPSIKVIGGLLVMCLGYIQLELGLLRDK